MRNQQLLYYYRGVGVHAVQKEAIRRYTKKLFDDTQKAENTHARSPDIHWIRVIICQSWLCRRSLTRLTLLGDIM